MERPAKDGTMRCTAGKDAETNKWKGKSLSIVADLCGRGMDDGSLLGGAVRGRSVPENDVYLIRRHHWPLGHHRPFLPNNKHQLRASYHQLLASLNERLQLKKHVISGKATLMQPSAHAACAAYHIFQFPPLPSALRFIGCPTCMTECKMGYSAASFVFVWVVRHSLPRRISACQKCFQTPLYTTSSSVYLAT